MFGLKTKQQTRPRAHRLAFVPSDGTPEERLDAIETFLSATSRQELDARQQEANRKEDGGFLAKHRDGLQRRRETEARIGAQVRALLNPEQDHNTDEIEDPILRDALADLIPRERFKTILVELGDVTPDRAELMFRDAVKTNIRHGSEAAAVSVQTVVGILAKLEGGK